MLLCHHIVFWMRHNRKPIVGKDQVIADNGKVFKIRYKRRWRKPSTWR